MTHEPDERIWEGEEALREIIESAERAEAREEPQKPSFWSLNNLIQLSSKLLWRRINN